MNPIKIKFKKVTIRDSVFLYTMLAQRKITTNISHKKMPSFVQHTKFVKSKPYSVWYIIILNDEKIGTVYLTKINEIGLHIKHEFQNSKIRKLIFDKVFQKHPRDRYLVNVNPKNKKQIKFLKEKGFRLIQYTYEITKDVK